MTLTSFVRVTHRVRICLVISCTSTYLYKLYVYECLQESLYVFCIVYEYIVMYEYVVSRCDCVVVAAFGYVLPAV